jgi:hypothetical protein
MRAGTGTKRRPAPPEKPRAGLIATAAVIGSCAVGGAGGGCLVPEYAVSSSASGTGGSGGTSSSSTSTGGSGGTTSSQGGNGGMTSSNTGGTAGTGGTGGTGGGPCPQPCLEWVNAYGGVGDDHALALAVVPEGNAGLVDRLELGGDLTNTVPFGGMMLSSTGGIDGYTAQLTPEGVLDKLAGFGSARAGLAPHSVRAVAFGPDGSVFVAGHFETKIVVPGAPFPLPGDGMTDVFVAKYDALGAHQWSVKLAGVGEDHIHGIAVDATGDLIAAGDFQKAIDCNGVPLTVTGGAGSGSSDAYVVKLKKGTGEVVWAKQLGATNNDGATGVAVDGAGDVTVVGYYQNTIGFESNPSITNGGGDDAFVLRLHANGSYGWLRGFGKVGHQAALAVAVAAPDQDVYVAGDFSGVIDLDTSYDNGDVAGSTSLFLAKLSPTKGDPIWSKVIENANLQNQLGLAVAPPSAPVKGLVLAGNFSKPANFGAGVVTPDGIDAFVLRLDGTNQYLWSKVYGGAGAQLARAAAFDSKGAVLVAGDFSGPTDFGKGELTPMMGTADAFVLKLQP